MHKSKTIPFCSIVSFYNIIHCHSFVNIAHLQTLQYMIYFIYIYHFTPRKEQESHAYVKST